MVRRDLAVLCALVTITTGCRRDSAPVVTNAAPSSASAPPAIPPEPPDSDALTEKLAAQSMTHDRFAARDLYTWTTAEQIEALRKGGPLLLRATSPTRGPALFDATLAADRDATSIAVAKILRRPDRTTRRFAWTNAWATRLGTDGESYGEKLVAVRLREDALVGRYMPGSAEPWAFARASGTPVTLADALVAIESLAAVYHVAPPVDGDAPSSAFREYALVNDAAVESWSFASGAAEAELRRSLDTMRLLRAYLRAVDVKPEDGAAFARVTVERAWASASGASPLDRYASALAFASPRYVPTAARIDAITVALEQSETQGAPLSGPSPSATARVVSPPNFRPRARRCGSGTFDVCPPQSTPPPPPKPLCIEPKTGRFIDCPPR